MDEEKREIVNEEQERCEGEGGSPAGCGCYRRWLTKEFWRGILLPWAQGDDDVHLEDVPVSVKVLCGISLFLMLNQVRFPFFGERIALSDLGFLLGFVPVFIYSLRQKRPFFLPLMSFVVVLAAVVANLFSASGLSGVKELCQLVEILICGVSVMSFLMETAPWLAVAVVVVSFLLNLGVARFAALPGGWGFGALPPADVLAQPWGIGRAFGGLFRSRMALGYFLAMAMAWLLPVVHGKRGCICRTIAGFLLTLLGLLGIVHGQMALVACLVLVPGMFLVSRRAGIATALALVAALAVSTGFLRISHSWALHDSLNPLKGTAHPGELKSNHLELVAAFRMMRRRPLTGVGSGRYQECIGACYQELPNPVKNDIETDTQSGWGIWMGTTGAVVTALLAVFLAAMASAGIRRYFISGENNTMALGGGLALLVFALGMVISDGMTRGLCWMMALALASALVPNPKEEIPSHTRISARGMLGLLILLALLIGCVALRKPQADPLSLKCSLQCQAQPAQESATPAPAPVRVLKVIDASEVLKLTPPFESGNDSAAAKGAVLKVPNGKGVPPEGKSPSIEYGGAVFSLEMPAAAECRVWLRVWWDDSCGNTVNLQVDDEPTSITVGNDGTYRSWHWLPASRIYRLSEGLHTITLLNREDGIMFDQMLVTNDMQYVPQDIEEGL